MTASAIHVENVRVPLSLVVDAERFGGIVEGRYLCGDLVLRNDKLHLTKTPSHTQPPKLVLPRLTEAHVHLDKCHSVDRMPAVGGDLRAAITAQSSDKSLWNADDLRQRATRGLKELIAAGCKIVRSHIDWPHGPDARTPPPAWHVLSEIAQDHRDQIQLQLCPLVSFSDLDDPETARVLGQECKRGGGVLGSFVLDQPNRSTGIRAAFEIAQRFELMLDFHVDEGLAQGLDGLSIIAQTAIERSFDAPVLCGHACSLMNLTGDALEQTLDVLARSDLRVVTMPTTNLYLQGREDGTPDRRGLTRIRELRGAGVPVVVGTENVRDAFCPLGRHDPRASLALAVLAAHLDPPLADLWPMITTDAERALGVTAMFVDQAQLCDLVICEASSTTAAFAGHAPLRPLETYASRSMP